MTIQELAEELLRKDIRQSMGSKEPDTVCPYRAAFVFALTCRTDFRKNSKAYKHYDAIIKWMMANWQKELD